MAPTTDRHKPILAGVDPAQGMHIPVPSRKEQRDAVNIFIKDVFKHQPLMILALTEFSTPLGY